MRKERQLLTRVRLDAIRIPKLLNSRWKRPYSTDSITPKVIFSGIQPTGIPHLGNYLGALQQWVKLQDEASSNTTLLYSLVDLHALTSHDEASQLRQWRREMLAALLAVGLNPERSIIFYQSAVPAHSELMWILSTNASMGYLSRMTQWKSKLDLPKDASPFSQAVTNKLKLGLFSYPVLQAADILVHRATHVPVGHDQSQHLEFARECANGFNHSHGRVLVPPETLLSPAKRVMSLTKPQLKMSKSHADPKSRIMIIDSREEIEKKVMSALTDSINAVSYDPVARPGVSNLLEILFHLDAIPKATSIRELAHGFREHSMRALKELVVDVIDRRFAPIRDKFFLLTAGSEIKRLEDAKSAGNAKANQNANYTMTIVRESLGL
ncbi:MAG: 28S ribosomal protein S10, mitochondrial [Bogoriella megaspora]|nr:MAG: 28S ribosomal protein S10, mitochondrial [Bogoriella megaspora]